MSSLQPSQPALTDTGSGQYTGRGEAFPAKAGNGPASPVLAPHQAVGKNRRKRRLVDDLKAYAFLAPYLSVFILFTLVPVGFGIYVSLHKWSTTLGNQGFAGLSNYSTLIEGQGYYGSQFYQAMSNTVLFVIISVPLLWAIPTGLAYAVFRSPAKGLWRILFFYPSVFSVTAFGSAWSLLLATNGGSVNSILHTDIHWLTGVPMAWLSIDLATIWATMGFSFIIMYAAVTQVPRIILEAAEIDGARPFARFRYVILPLLRRASIVVIIIETIASFNLFAQDQIMTGGGPGYDTTTISMNIYNQAFSSFNIGGATAAAFLLAIVLAVIAFIQLRVSRRRA
ncbi:MAG: carbohydrate ABC transporter permease [Acidimicrobiales bacterium]|jgi:multiple sugar transport system permease protein